MFDIWQGVVPLYDSYPIIPQRKVSVPGNGKIDLEVTFVPSSLGTSEKHTCHIEFSSPQVPNFLLLSIPGFRSFLFFQYLAETNPPMFVSF